VVEKVIILLYAYDFLLWFYINHTPISYSFEIDDEFNRN